jgi:hypothetical protein
VRRRAVLAAAFAAAATLTACGGADEGAPSQQPVPATTAPDPEKAREAARKLLEEFEKCDSCTGAERARERAENGLAQKSDGPVVLLPETSEP